MAKVIKTKDVEHMALLSRMNLTSDDKKKYSDQFSDILDYFSKLQEVNTSGVDEISQISGLNNIWQDDKLGEKFGQKKMLSNAPDKENGHIKVRQVLK